MLLLQYTIIDIIPILYCKVSYYRYFIKLRWDLGWLATHPWSGTLCSSSPYIHNSNRNIRDKFTLLLPSTRLACTRINTIMVLVTVTCVLGVLVLLLLCVGVELWIACIYMYVCMCITSKSIRLDDNINTDYSLHGIR